MTPSSCASASVLAFGPVGTAGAIVNVASTWSVPATSSGAPGLPSTGNPLSIEKLPISTNWYRPGVNVPATVTGRTVGSPLRSNGSTTMLLSSLKIVPSESTSYSAKSNPTDVGSKGWLKVTLMTEGEPLTTDPSCGSMPTTLNVLRSVLVDETSAAESAA